ncbi:hypothetical protein RHMOL_Rhmol04G0062000 [Rhododendron molle]|uniref:Uncharacterized protein n=1 Tax=Rhododendron molle TaxID=49168 RepID=A0ACC0NXP5_RHOML|nr:hypothetical protein RHMOL_Rhmol04G0062000 [Rhododendron molle]
MTKPFKTVLFSCFLISLFSSASAQTCNNFTFSSNRLFTTCTALPYLNAFLHWNYHPSNGTVDIAYRHTGIASSRWVAWALNLKGQGMIGAQCLVALHNSSGLPYAYTSSVDSYDTSIGETPLSFQVQRVSTEYVSHEMIIFATLVLPNNQTSFHQVWNDGLVSGGAPQSHPTNGDNLKSMGSVDFASGISYSSSGGGGSQQKKKNVHGVLNAISWGTLMPIGAMTARYVKVFKAADPAWFYLHVACQCCAYIIGVAGWATGLALGNHTGIHTNSHGKIGMTIFILGTLQVCALLLRPKKDNKYRLYWNFYHWSVGYTEIILSIVNIFEGFDILDPGKNWKRAYIGILIFLGITAAFLEAYTWYVVLKRKKTESGTYPDVGIGANGDTSAQTCDNFTFSSNRLFTTCTALPYLNAFLHWNYHPSNGTVNIAYRHTGIASSRWVAWALNLKGQGMIGAQCLVASHNSSGLPYAYTSSVDSYDTSLGETPLSFQVQRVSTEYVSNEMIIFATLVLPNNQTSFHQVWNDGPVSGGAPQSHPTNGDNLKSVGSVGFASGISNSSSGGGGSQQQKKKNVHGVLNAISWGTLMPIGAMTARYMKVFKSADPAWFYLHVACQCCAYVIGVAGWATGLALGNNTGIHTNSHGKIGMTIFILGTLQVCALLLRPKKDNKYRLYWNFEGFDILDPGKNRKRAYIGILIFLGITAAFLEAYTWYVVLKRKKTESGRYPDVGIGANGDSGCGTRSQQEV